MKVILLTFFFVILTSCGGRNEDYLGNNIELWKESEIWDFAKYVSKHQFMKAEQVLTQKSLNIDYREPKYGETLLSWAVLNNDIPAVKFLVNHGADPNKHNTYNGESPILDAAGEFNSAEVLEYLLEHGGNPNDYVKEHEILSHGRSVKTPLIAASFISLEKTKMLVQAGADANFSVEPGHTAYLQAALRLKMDILEYLLSNCKIDYCKTYIVTIDTKDTLYLKDLIIKNRVAYRQDSITVKRITDSILVQAIK